MTRHTVKGQFIPVIAFALLGLLLLAGCPNKAKKDTGTGSSGAAGSTTGQAGQGQPDPEMMKQYQKMREEHKYAFQLSGTTRSIGRLERDGLAPLTAAQAKSILAVLTPLRSKTALSEDDAKAAIKGINAALTEKQLNAIDKMASERRNRPRQGGGSGGNGRPGGPGGGRQGNRQFNPDAMKNYNPLNPSKDSPMAESMQQFFDMLEKKAKG